MREEGNNTSKQAAPSSRLHRFETHEQCDRAHCPICEGGLLACVVCGQAEVELTPECPGPSAGTSKQAAPPSRLAAQLREAGQWVEVWRLPSESILAAADLIESQAARIAELEAQLAAVTRERDEVRRGRLGDQDEANRYIAELEARIAAHEAEPLVGYALYEVGRIFWTDGADDPLTLAKECAKANSCRVVALHAREIGEEVAGE